MTKRFWRNVALPIVMGALAAPFMVNCGSLPKVPGVPGIPGAGGCPDTSSVEGIAKFDFAKEWNIQADVSTKLKSGVIAAMELKAFADKIDGDLKGACTQIATDLGQTGTYANADAACKAAITGMGAVKAKMGASAQLALDFVPPKCGASMKVMADCAGHCDASVSGGQAKVECEPGKLEGTCSGQCDGSCDMSAAATCSGTCQGSCDATFSGTCTGNCNGKCDGKNASGSCSGKCEGKCDAGAKGTCGGKCGGSCQMKAAASCQGTCSGKCSVEMQEPKCTGEVTPPKMSADCKARCDSEVSAKMECTPGTVALRITGAADANAAATFKAAIEKSLPVVLKVAIGLGERSVKIAGQIKDVVGGVQGAVEGSIKAGGAAGAMTAARVGACFSGQFKGALDAAGSIKGNVDVSVNIKASASASGSASGKAG